MRSIKLISTLIFIAVIAAGWPHKSLGFPAYLVKTRKFGAQDCAFCHLHPEGGGPFNERGQWLMQEKERRQAEIINPDWLADYKAETSEPAPATKPAVQPAADAELTDELIKLALAWAEAAQRNDQAALKALLADEFLATDEQGRVIDKAQYLAEAADLKLESFSLSEAKVRRLGEVAISSVRWQMKGSYQGKDLSGAYRETTVWVKATTGWQAIATHVSPIR